jgi:hypothetical protein
MSDHNPEATTAAEQAKKSSSRLYQKFEQSKKMTLSNLISKAMLLEVQHIEKGAKE